MTIIFHPDDALRQIASYQRQEAQSVRQTTRATRVLVAETRELLDHPMWSVMSSPCTPMKGD